MENQHKIPIKLAQGSDIFHFSKNEEADGDIEIREVLGRGTGSSWQAATVIVVSSKEDDSGKLTKKVVTTMDVPDAWLEFPDEVIIERFIKGFNGGK